MKYPFTDDESGEECEYDDETFTFSPIYAIRIGKFQVETKPGDKEYHVVITPTKFEGYRYPDRIDLIYDTYSTKDRAMDKLHEVYDHEFRNWAAEAQRGYVLQFGQPYDLQTIKFSCKLEDHFGNDAFFQFTPDTYWMDVGDWKNANVTHIMVVGVARIQRCENPCCTEVATL